VFFLSLWAHYSKMRGGGKASGLGRSLSRAGLNSFRRTKMIMLNPKPELQGWWYPYSDAFFAAREAL
jgi:hypothetical protein